eukprot:COSAG01_NODE_54611_length_331_cov_0.504310_1_plen_101_part_10
MCHEPGTDGTGCARTPSGRCSGASRRPTSSGTVCVVTVGHQCTLPCPAQHHPPLLRVVDHHSGWSEPDARYDDGNRLRGKTVWVEGYGQGVVKYFKKLSGR